MVIEIEEMYTGLIMIIMHAKGGNVRNIRSTKVKRMDVSTNSSVNITKLIGVFAVP